MPNIPIVRIQHEVGHAFISATRRFALSRHPKPSSEVILENGVPLPGPASAIHEEIRSLGGGRYRFWRNSVYFSTPDNSDPRTNGRRYAIAYQRRLWQLAWPFSQLLLPVERAARCLRSLFQREQRRQAFWGTLYWVCFAYVAWCRKWFIWGKRHL
jgi:hypothetical protein